MFLTERRRLFRFGITKGLGPVGPDPDFGISLTDPLVERAVGRVAFQQIAFARNIVLKLAGARGAGTVLAEKLHEQQLEKLQFEGMHPLVLDEWRLAQLPDLFLNRGTCPKAARARRTREIRNALDIQVKKILIEDRGGQIRTGVIRTPVVNGV